MVIVVAATGCGQGFDRQAAIDSFQTANPEATAEGSACVVDGLIERYGPDALEAELAADPPAADFEETQFRWMFRCDVAGDWQDQIAAQLVDNGVAAEDAPCVAERLLATMDDGDVDVLLSGTITESFSDTFSGALDHCGAFDG